MHAIWKHVFYSRCSLWMEPTRQVAFTAIELTRSPNMVTAEDLRGPSGDSSRPQQLLKVMKTTTITIIYQLYIYIHISDDFYVVPARREQCGAAQGGHAVRASAETTCLIYIPRAAERVCPQLPSMFLPQGVGKH